MLRIVMEGNEVKIDKGKKRRKSVPCVSVDLHFYQLTKKFAICPRVNNA